MHIWFKKYGQGYMKLLADKKKNPKNKRRDRNGVKIAYIRKNSIHACGSETYEINK